MSVFVFTVKDPLGREVRLTENCYTSHILLEHPELSDVNQIATTITSPTVIARDVVDPQRLVYYRTYQAQPQRWLKVVVEQGEIITAYRARRLKKGETIQWRQ